MRLEYFASKITTKGKHKTTLFMDVPRTNEYVRQFVQGSPSFVIWTFFDTLECQSPKIVETYNWNY
jgi:hypothetical protein